MSEVRTFQWQGETITGTIETTHRTANGTRHFVKLTEKPKKEFSREGHVWPIAGSVVLADFE